MTDRLRRRPLYAADNEDARTEIAALAPSIADTVVCIAAGGGRALSLLGTGARRFVAVDRRESQLHLLELEAAAIDALPYAHLRAFLGVDPARDRLDVYAVLRRALSPRARRYWSTRRGLIARGVLYAGRLETMLARSSAWLRKAGVLRWPEAAFAARTLEEQREVLRREAHDVLRAGRAWTALLHPVAVALLLQDPSFRRSTEGRVGRYLHGRMLDFALRRLLRESFLLHLIYFGRYDPHGALPLWLTPDGAERARKELPRLQLRHATLDEVAAAVPRDAAICWSLSDVSAWTSEAAFHTLLGRLVAASPPGSRLCWRHLAAHWRTPPLPRLEVDAETSRALTQADASVFYEVARATVIEPPAAPP